MFLKLFWKTCSLNFLHILGKMAVLVVCIYYIFLSSLSNNGSLFNVFLATVKENNVENEMSGELPFSRLKMGDRKQGLPLLESPPFLTAKMAIYANFILYICFI